MICFDVFNMSLTVEEISGLVSELDEPLARARVEKVQSRDVHSLILTLKLPHEFREEHLNRIILLLSTRPGFARVHLVEERGTILESPGPFTLLVRKKLQGARLERILQPGSVPSMEIEFEAPGTARSLPARLILVAELQGASNLLLLDGERRLLGALLPARGGIGVPYSPIRKEGKHRIQDSSPPPSISSDTGFPDRAGFPDKGSGVNPLQVRFPRSLALERRYAVEEAKARFQERRIALQKDISRALKKHRSLLVRLQGDLSRARKGEEGLRLGELLKAELHSLKRGMDRVEVVDYYSPDLQKVTIPLDAALSPQENIERQFRRYRKARRGVPVITKRLSHIEGEIALLEQIGREAEQMENEASLEELEARARPHRRDRLKRPSGVPEPDHPGRQAGPRRFLSREGLEILVGRRGRENDELTFRIARGNDLFLHVVGRPGAHVVVRTSGGKPVPLETLLDAAQLALYYSLPGRSRGQIARGASAEVDYVEVKHVRKPRGGKPGEVLLAHRRTLRVKLDEERLDRLRGRDRGFLGEGPEVR